MTPQEMESQITDDDNTLASRKVFAEKAHFYFDCACAKYVVIDFGHKVLVGLYVIMGHGATKEEAKKQAVEEAKKLGWESCASMRVVYVSD